MADDEEGEEEETKAESGKRKAGGKTTAPKKATKKAAKPKVTKQPWPKDRNERTKAVQTVLASGKPLSPSELAKHFTRGNEEQIEDILEALVLLGQATKRGGKYGV